MRVLLVSHTCQSLTEGQPKVVALGRHRDVELKVVVPDRWQPYGNGPLEIMPSAERWINVHRVIWPSAGPALFYLHWYPGLGKTIQTFQPDVIDVWEEPWGLLSRQVCWLRHRYAPKAKLLLETEQNLDKHLPFPFEGFRRRSLRAADWLVGRSREAVAVARQKGYEGSELMGIWKHWG